MRLEAMLFRAFLLIFMTSLVGLGSLAVYFDHESSSWKELETLHAKDKHKYATECLEDSKKFKHQSISCELVPSAQKSMEEAEENMYSFNEKAELFTTLAWAVPLFFMFAFYGGRWVVSGRVTPLWPIRDSAR